MATKMFVCPNCKSAYSGEEKSFGKICQECSSVLLTMNIDVEVYRSLSQEEKEEEKTREIDNQLREQERRQSEDLKNRRIDDKLLKIYQDRKDKFNLLEEKSFPNLYDYKIEKVGNLPNGASDDVKIQRLLIHYAERGWKLHTIYSNELGKNANSAGYGGMNSGTNATISEDVLVFERMMI